MAYTVFALKWRPKNFEEVMGQGHIVSTLKNAIEKNRIASAYLFAGPRGVGKTSTARILAKSLNCKSGPTASPCQKCSSCLEINEGRSLDVIEIDGASNRGIDEIRVLRENVKFSPAASKFKIYIIDEVHMLTTEAFNALLKTLEEPPEFVKFIFATTQPHKVLPTILSRCQRFDFRRISMLEISGQLERIVKEEKLSVDKEVIFAIASSSDGSLRDAESVLDQLVSFSRDKVSLKDIVSVLGLVEQETLFEVTEKIIQKDPAGALTLLNRIIDNGKDISVFLTSLIEHFRNLMVARVTNGDTKLIDLPSEICARLLKQGEAFSLEEIFSFFNILVSTQEISKRLDSLRIPLEVSLIRLTQGKKGPSSPSPISHSSAHSKVDELKPAAEAKALPKEETPAAEDPPAQLISLDAIRGAWQNIIESLSKVKISVATYLHEGEPVKVQGNTLTISFPSNYSLHKESLEKKDNKAIIERCLSELFKANLRIGLILSNQRKDSEDSRNNPFVKSALDMFNGRVIKEG